MSSPYGYQDVELEYGKDYLDGFIYTARVTPDDVEEMLHEMYGDDLDALYAGTGYDEEYGIHSFEEAADEIVRTHEVDTFIDFDVMLEFYEDEARDEFLREVDDGDIDGSDYYRYIDNECKEIGEEMDYDFCHRK